MDLCVFDECKPCSVLKSSSESSRTNTVCTPVYLLPSTVGKDQSGNPYQDPGSERPAAVHQSQRRPRGVGHRTSSSSKATRLSGQLKQAQRLAPRYKEPGPAGGVLFDGEVIKIDGHPASYL